MARTPIHPGEILKDELDELGISAAELARQIEVPPNRVSQILAGRRAITADTALRLGRWFGTSAELWMNLRQAFELDLARQIVEGLSADFEPEELSSAYRSDLRALLEAKLRGEEIAEPEPTPEPAPAVDLIEATSDAGVFMQLSGILKRSAIKLSKIINTHQ